MAYQRPNHKKSFDPTPLEANFGTENFTIKDDPAWIAPNLVELHEDGVFGLHQLKSAIEHSMKQDYSEYRRDVANQKKIEGVKKAREATLTFLKKAIDKAQTEVNAVKGAILRISEPIIPKDDIKALRIETRLKEAREIVRSVDPKKRPDLIRGNLLFIQACIDSPDQLLSEKNLEEIRREFAFSQDPSLRDCEADTEQLYRHIRARAGEINAHAVRMLWEMMDIDDPITPYQHFETFPPISDYDKELASRVIHSYEKKQSEIARKKKFDEKNKGINLEAQARGKKYQSGASIAH